MFNIHIKHLHSWASVAVQEEPFVERERDRERETHTHRERAITTEKFNLGFVHISKK